MPFLFHLKKSKTMTTRKKPSIKKIQRAAAEMGIYLSKERAKKFRDSVCNSTRLNDIFKEMDELNL